MNIITVDFESYYSKEFGFSKMTTEEYVRHPDFEVIGIGIKVNDEETTWHTGTHAELAEVFKDYDWKNSFVLAHNTAFDGAILSWLFGIRPKGWLDTLSMARAIHGVSVGGSLAKLAIHYNLGQKGTEVNDALGKRRLDFTPQDLAQYGEYCKNDVELCYTMFQRMMLPGIGEGFPMFELKVIDATLKMFIEPALELDLPLLEQHLEDVKARKERLLQAAAAATRKDDAPPEEKSAADKDVLMSNDKFAELLLALKNKDTGKPVFKSADMLPRKTSLKTGKEAWAFAKTDEEFKALAEHPDVRVQVLVSARLGNKSTLEETRTQRFIDIAKRGKLPVPLKYYGARTGRWAAEGSINLQNVPRGSKLKQAIKAPPGYQIVGADLSNIELRVGLWIAGQMMQLQQLGAGKDLYKDFAASVFGVPYDEVTKEQRFIGKTSQLSLIYGTGAAKLRAAIKTMSGKDIGDTEAQRIVDLYRSTYPAVKRAWEMGGKAIECMASNQNFAFGHEGFAEVHGSKGILLPSGLYMPYPGLRQVEVNGKRQWEYQIRTGWDKLYGAKVFQGLTQATARCIMAVQMMAIQKKYPIALTVHDALYLVVKKDVAPQVLEFVLTQMRIAPKWIQGIPLDAEGGFGDSLADC